MLAHIDQSRLHTRDGTALPLRHWPAANEAIGIIIALHSFTDYSGAFDAIGPWFADRGYHVYAYDQRGFGASPQAGSWPGASALANDLVDALAATRITHDAPPLPVFVLGVSMGGSVALVAAAGLAPSQAPAGLILAAPGVRENLPLRPLWDALLWGAAAIIPGASVAVHRKSNPLLNPSSNQRLLQDPLVQRRVRADTYYGVITLADAASIAAGQIKVPTLLLHGSEDSLVHRRSICAAQAQMAPLSALKLYPSAPHLLLHWRQQHTVLADISQWLERDDHLVNNASRCDS